MKLKTIDIRGNAYVTVNERLKYFREHYENYRLISEVVSFENGICLIKSSILNEKGEVLATGHAYEKEGSTQVNKTSYVENCETSSWGRTLGNFGIGIDAAVASYDEVANAIKQQAEPKKKVAKESAHTDIETIKKEHLEKLIFDEVNSQSELTRMWIDLTLKQQADEQILNWFTVRKLQLTGERNG